MIRFLSSAGGIAAAALAFVVAALLLSAAVRADGGRRFAVPRATGARPPALTLRSAFGGKSLSGGTRRNGGFSTSLRRGRHDLFWFLGREFYRDGIRTGLMNWTVRTGGPVNSAPMSTTGACTSLE
jgi:hypothetical protein